MKTFRKHSSKLTVFKERFKRKEQDKASFEYVDDLDASYLPSLTNKPLVLGEQPPPQAEMVPAPPSPPQEPRLEQFDIPPVQRAVVVTHTGLRPQFKVVSDYPVPEIKKYEVLVRIIYTGVCHSDVSCFKGEWGFTGSCKVGGHEGVGYVVKAGEDHARLIGKQVGIPLIYNPCGYCDACEVDTSFCDQTPYYGSVIDGTWMQYNVVNVKNIVVLPEFSYDLSHVAPLLCAGVTVYKALTLASDRGYVAIVGAGGGLGLLAVQYARAMGMRTIGIDLTDKKAAVLEMGADAFVDHTCKDVTQQVMSITNNKGASSVLMIAPSDIAYTQAFDYLGYCGVLVAVAMTGGEVKINPFRLVAKGHRVVGTLVGNKQDMESALNMAAEHNIRPLVTLEPMYDIQRVVDDMQAGRLRGRSVLDMR